MASQRGLRRRTLAGLAALAIVVAAGAGLPGGPGGGAARTSQSGAVEASARAATGRPAARFVVAGDVGTADEQERRTAAAAASRAGSRGWDALVLLGDNVYEDGDPHRVDSAVFEPFAPVLRPGLPLLAALGNHDTDSGHGSAQLEALGQPGPWFARRIGPLLLVVLDSNRPEDPEQLAWLRRTLARDDATWTVAAMHHPMHSAGHHGSDREVRRAFASLFAEFDVQLALAGHDHDYQRSRVIDGTTYVVSGAAAKLRPTGSNTDTVVSRSVRHFLDVSAYADRLVVQGVDQHGTVFDGVVICSGRPQTARRAPCRALAQAHGRTSIDRTSILRSSCCASVPAGPGDRTHRTSRLAAPSWTPYSSPSTSAPRRAAPT